MRKLLILVGLVFGLAGCGTYFPHNANESYEKAKAYPVDKFTGKSSVVGEDYNSGEVMYCYLVTSVDENILPTTFFTCRSVMQGWAFFDTAYDAKKNKRELNILDRQVMPGGVQEKVSIQLTNEEFLDGIHKGMSFKIEGRQSYDIVQIPAFYFEGYSNKLTEHLKYRLSLKNK